MVGLFYFLWDFSAAMFSGFAMSTPFLHSIGAIVGSAVGIRAYRLNWFELDGEDLFSRFKELFGGPSDDGQPKPESKPSLPKARPQKFGKLNNQLHLFEQYTRKRNYPLMLMKLKQITYDHPEHEFGERQLIAMISRGTTEQDWQNVLGWMDEYLTRFNSNAVTIRLNKARILAVVQHSPRAARASLAAIEPSKLSPKQKTVYFQLMKRTRQQLMEGVIEVQQPSADHYGQTTETNRL